MKRLVGLVLSTVIIIAVMASCGDKYVWMNYKYDKYITLPNYKEISVDINSKEFVEYYTGYLNSLLDNANLSKKKEKTTTVADGDTVNIDFEGKINGESFDGNSGSDYDLVIGSDSFIDGFEDGLIGAKKGETRDLKLQFPSDYHNAEFAGKDVVFTVTVNKISETVYPELDEDIAKSLGYETLDECKDDIQKSTVYYYIWDDIAEKTTVSSYPNDLIDDIIDMDIDYLKQVAKNKNMTYEDYLAKAGYEDEKSFRKAYSEDDSVKLEAKEHLIFYAICDAEDLYPKTDEEYEDHIKTLAEANNMTVDSIKNNIDEKIIEISIVRELVRQYFEANINVIDIK